LVIQGSATFVPLMAIVSNLSRSWFELLSPPGWLGPNSVFAVPSDVDFDEKIQRLIDRRNPEFHNPPSSAPIV
jgi:hypothetical protein